MPKKQKMDVVQNAVDIARTVTDDSYKSKLRRPRKSYRIDVLKKDEPRDDNGHPGVPDSGGRSA